jgi:hypothetical protein
MPRDERSRPHRMTREELDEGQWEMRRRMAVRKSTSPDAVLAQLYGRLDEAYDLAFRAADMGVITDDVKHLVMDAWSAVRRIRDRGR